MGDLTVPGNARLLTEVYGRRIRKNVRKLEQERSWLDIKKNFFVMKTVTLWRRLPRKLCSLHPWRLSRCN